MSTLSTPTQPATDVASEPLTNKRLNALEVEGLAALKLGLRGLHQIQEDDPGAAKQVQHEYGNIAPLVQRSFDKMRALPEGERSPQDLLGAMRAYFEFIEGAVRKKEAADRTALSAGTELEDLKILHAAKRANRRLAMMCVAKQVNLNGQWTAIYNEINTAINAAEGRSNV